MKIKAGTTDGTGELSDNDREIMEQGYALAKKVLTVMASHPIVSGQIIGLCIAVCTTSVLRTEMTMLQVPPEQRKEVLAETMADFARLVHDLYEQAEMAAPLPDPVSDPAKAN